MTRFQADCLLLITAIIWGTAFIAQKTGMEGLGPYGFVGVRFALSFLVVLPFALRERHRVPRNAKPLEGLWLAGLCLVFLGGVILQQVGIKYTSVTNAGFLTGLYVVGVPFAAWLLFRRRPSWIVIPICLLAVAGTWLLNGASLSAFKTGDLLVMACAVCFAIQVPLLGLLVQSTARPLTLSVIQYAACAVVGLVLAISLEGLTFDVILHNFPQLFYAGVVSGGIAYTLQAIAQQYTPPADAAIILAGEALFAAIAGAWILGDRLDMMGWAGCGLILTAILAVELSSFFVERRKKKSASISAR